MNPQNQKKPEPARKKPPVRLLLLLILSIMAVFTVYRVFAVELRQGWMFWVYYGLTIAVGIAYIFYNFGLSRRHVTRDMLPKEWSNAEKDAFFRETEERKRKSRFLLILLISFLFTFGFDIIELFMPDVLMRLFPWLR